MIKEAERHDEKVLTLEKPITAEVWEYLCEQVEQLVNSNVRPLKTLIVPNEKDPEGSNSINGAGNGSISEPNSNIFSIMEDEECQILYHKIEKLIAA